MRFSNEQAEVPSGVTLHSASALLPGRDLPGAVLSNDRLSTLVSRVGRELWRRGFAREVPPCAPEFPEERVGIRTRSVLDDELSARDLAVAAARASLERGKVDPERIRAAVVCTVTPDRVVPAMATTVAHELGLPPSATAFDLSLGCNGFVAGLDVASRLLAAAPEGACALVIGSDTMSRVLDASDRTTCTLFGDGAGAVVLERTRESKLAPVRMATLGEGGPWIEIRPPRTAPEPLFRFASSNGGTYLREERCSRQRVVMNGRRVFRDMVRTIPVLLRGYLDDQGLGVEGIDRFAFHQANARLVGAVADAPELRIPEHKLLMNIAYAGNTTSASIPVLLGEASQRGELSPGERVALIGFGTGYSLGMTVLEWT